MSKFPLIAVTTLAVAIAALSLAPMQATASVTLVVDALDILDNTGSLAPLNTVGLLIVDTSGGTSLSPTLTPGENIAVGTTLAGTTDKIIAVIDINNSTGATGWIELVVSDMTYGSGLGAGVAAGQKFGIIWLVNQSLNVTNVEAGYYGEFSDWQGNYSNPWTMPTNGEFMEYDMTTVSEGGSVPNSDGLANFLVGGAPLGSTNTWSRATGGKWETATNWSSGFAPSTDDAADVITNASSKTVTVDSTTVLSNALNGCMTINNLSVAGTANTTNTLSLSNAGLLTPLDILNSFTITANGMVLVTNSILQVNTLSGGGFNIDGRIVVESNGSVIATNNPTNVGNNGVGQMTVSNGTLLVNQIEVGNNPGSQGTLTIAGGTTTFLSFCNVGDSAGATGAVWIAGGELIASGSTAVGVGGIGQLTVSNGAMSAAGMVLGYSPGSSGTLTVAGGTNSIGGYGLDIGNYLSTGTLWMTGGQLVNLGTATLGWDGAGRVTVSNGLFLGANMFVGYDINSQGGTLTIAGGTVSLSSYLSVGRFTGATGAVWVTGGQLNVTNNATAIGDGSVGGGGVGQMTVSNGTWLAQNVYVGTYSSSPGTLTLGCGNLTIAGGTNSISELLYLGNGVNTTGSVWVTGGQLNVANSPIIVGVTGSGRMTVSNGTVSVGSLIVTNNINGAVINTNTFTLAGGTLDSAGTAVTNSLAFAAGNGIAAATFVLNGGAHSFANNLEIRNNATLSGCGTVNGNVTVDAGGTIISTCATQTFSGAVTNNGDIVAANGTVIDFLGPVVNNGQINATNGAAQFYGGLVNNGTILTNTIPAIGTNSWINGTGKWETAANWSLGSAPSTNDYADVITNASSKAVIIDASTVLSNALNGCLTIGSLYIANSVGSTNALFLNDAGTNSPFEVIGAGLTLDTNGALVVNNSALVATNGSGQLYVGDTGGNAFLMITNGGVAYSASGYLGGDNSSSNNTALVSGTGSVWNNSGTLSIGYNGGVNTLIITNGGAVVDEAGYLGNNGSFSSDNTVLISGAGAVWSNGGTVSVGQHGSANLMVIADGGAVYDSLAYVGHVGFSSNNAVLVTGMHSVWSSSGTVKIGDDDMGGDQMIISNGGAVYSSSGDLGETSSSDNNTVLVSGTGSVWSNSATLSIGYGSVGNLLMITNGGAVVAGDAVVGYSFPASNNIIQVNGGGLAVSSGGSAELVVSEAGGQDSLIVNSGTVTVDQLVATNGANSIVTLDGGTLTSGGTFVTNNQTFVVGDGTDAATFQMNGGVHNFANNLTVQNNATLTGCGTVNGNVTVDAGGSIVSTCATQTFSGAVTNNGIIVAANGTVINFDGPMVNTPSGTIVGTNGTVQFFSSFQNNGTFLENIPIVPTNSWINGGSGKWETAANWSLGVAPSTNDSADVIANTSTKTVTVDETTVLSNSLNGCMTISNLAVSAPAGSVNTLALTNTGTLSTPLLVGGTVTIGGGGVITETNSTLEVDSSDGGPADLDAVVVGVSGSGNTLAITNGGVLNDVHGVIGDNSASSGNSVLVVGSGSVWSNGPYLYVGRSGWGNSLIISNGGAVYDSEGIVGPTVEGSNNTVLVSDSGSVWSNESFADVSEYSSGNSLIISNGGAVYSSDGAMGWETSSSNNTVVITGSNSIWSSETYFYIGRDGGSNVFTIAGGTVTATNVTIGVDTTASNNVLIVSGGSLLVTDTQANAALVVSEDGGTNTFLLAGGAVTVNSLVATNGASSIVVFNSGTLASDGTYVTNSQTFLVGDGEDAATFEMNGGTHNFANNLVIQNNATLTGCGTINGNVLVDSGGTVLANCGGTLSFTGAVTNNSDLVAVNGTTINFLGPVVNNGVINATNGLAQFYGGIINTGTGTVLNPNSWIDGNGKWENSNDWSLGVAPSLNDHVDLIANGGNNTVTIDATTVSNAPGSLSISNLILRANTLSLDNAGTNVPLQVLGQFLMTNGASLLITNSAMQVFGGPVVPIAGSDISLLSGSFAIGSNTLALGSVGNASTLTVADGTALMGGLNVGTGGDGTGTVLVTGGTLFVTNATSTGQLSLYNGTFALSNGATVVADLYTNIGGTFTNLGGTFVINSHATVNQGTATFSAGTTQIGSNFTVAATAGSTGSVAVTGGSLIATNATTTIGSGNGSVGSLTVSNATVATGEIEVGGNTNSVGNLSVQAGGQMSVSSNLLVANFFNSTGMVNVAGGQLTATNGVIGFGNNGTLVTGYGYGQMMVTNGTVVANQILLGSSTGGHGDLMIQPNGVVNLVGSNALLVPDGVEIDGGELTIENGDIQCGQASATGVYYPCTVTMTGGVATVAIVYVGYTGGGTLTISGGQMSVSPLLDIGYSSGSAGAVAMSGGMLTASAMILGDSGVGQLSLSDSGIIQVTSSFSVGASGTAGSAGALTVAGGALAASAPVYVGAGSVWVSGGQLTAPGLVVGYNNYGSGQVTISNGLVQATSLILTNGSNSQIALLGGTLESGGTVVTNNQRFVVGNGSTAATFNLMAGVHWFGNGLEITSNSVVSGCGTVNGNVVVDPGGLVLANCGTLTFNNIVTNNGLLLADGGSTLEAYGNVFNNGTIDAINGSTNFHVGFINLGTILTAAKVAISQVSPSGQNFVVQVPSVTGHTYQLQYSTSIVSPTWTNTGASQAGTGGVLTFTDYGATATPQHFYRVLVTAP